jgi:hypothetical protein
MEESVSDKVVNRVLDLWDAGIKDDSIIESKLQEEFGISTDEAETVIEFTKAGLFRAMIISKGQRYPQNNLPKHPIMKSALKAGLIRLKDSDLDERTVRKLKPWWKFW